MIKANPEIIYVDTDVYCVKPIDIENPYLFGYQTFINPGRCVVNGAVLRLPAESKLLATMLEFMENEYPKPYWLPDKFKDEIEESHANGTPMHVSEMRWGIWGPGGLTAFSRETGEMKHALSVDHFYPITFADRNLLFKRPMTTLAKLTENTYTIHMWAPIKRFAAAQFDGLCPPKSYIGAQLRLIGVDPANAPIPQSKERRAVVQD